MHQKLKISEYFSEDNIKRAEVLEYDDGYVVDFYENNEYAYSLVYTGKTLSFVENAAEDYVLGRSPKYKEYTEV